MAFPRKSIEDVSVSDVKICEFCKQEFQRPSNYTWNWDKRRFCSKPCADKASRSPPASKVCKACGKTFWRTPLNQSYWDKMRCCSPACGFMGRRIKSEPKVCKVCGRSFTKPSICSQKGWAKRLYCSRKCSANSPEGRARRAITAKLVSRKLIEIGQLQALGKKWGPRNGRINGKKNVESGSIFKIATFDSCSKGGKIGGRHTHQLHPELGAKNIRNITHEQHVANGKKYGRLGYDAMIKLHPDAPAVNGRKNIWKAIAASRPPISHLEQRAFSLFLHYGLPFDFVGDLRSNPIGGKYPDFLHVSQKLVIEISHKNEKEFSYNRKMKKTGKPTYPDIGQYWKQYEKERIEYFKKFGYDCIVLWDDMSDEKMVELAEAALKPTV